METHLSPPQRKVTRVSRKVSSTNKGFLAHAATRKARNAIDSFENLMRDRLRDATKEQIVGACVAIALTLIIFFYSLYVGNYLVPLIVIAVWVTT